jgi:16S rRNA (uracil1498-N3)-methyltransferase
MQVSDLAPLSQTLAEPADLTLLAQPGAPVISDLADRLRQAASVRVMIGPEGGFTDDEVQAMQARGATPWSLGPHILRIETAAVAAAAVVRYLAPTPPMTKPDDWTTGDLRV